MDEQRDVLDLGEIGDNGIGAAGPRRRRLRGLAEPALFVAAAVALVLVAQHASAPPATPAGPPGGAAAADPSGHPTVVAPSTARAGEVVTVATYRRRGTCGAAEITFDGVPVRQRQVRYFDALDPDWVGMQVTFAIPPTAAAGPHEIALRGPAPECGPQVVLAAATITMAAG